MNAAARLERAPLPAAFLAAVERLIPAERRFDDPLSTLAFGTDASFYRLIPKLVVRVESEAEVIAPVSYTHLRAHETRDNIVCRLLLEKKKNGMSGVASLGNL